MRGGMNSCLVRFVADGYLVVTSRNYMRRAEAEAGCGDDCSCWQPHGTEDGVQVFSTGERRRLVELVACGPVRHFRWT